MVEEETICGVTLLHFLGSGGKKMGARRSAISSTELSSLLSQLEMSFVVLPYRKGIAPAFMGLSGQ